MTTKIWKNVDGIKIKIGNKKADLALKLLDLRIKDIQKEQDNFIKNKMWTSAAMMDHYITGMKFAFYKIHDELKSK